VVVVSLGLGLDRRPLGSVFTVINWRARPYMVFLGVRMFRDRNELARMLDAAVVPRGTQRCCARGQSGGHEPEGRDPDDRGAAAVRRSRCGHVQLQLLLLVRSRWVVGL